MNKFIISGYLIKDPESHATKSGKNYIKTSIAVKRNFKNAEGKYDADFFNLIAWEHKAKFFENYLGKGSRVIIEGRIQNNNYTDKDGKKHYTDDVIVENVEFAGGGKSEKTNESAADDFAGEPVDDEDVPF